jgi:GTP-binding protein
MPNAGKSTLSRAVSSARPKVADYPFTTLHPNLGVVRVAEHRSFVMADVPGLIEGAAEGTGLGVRFLKHLSRTRLLLHLVDIGPLTDPVADSAVILKELEQFSPELAGRERWLVFNKVDLVASDEREARCRAVIDALGWQGPTYEISGLRQEGTDALMQDVMVYLDSVRALEDAGEGG